MTIDTDKMVSILKENEPLSVMVVEEHNADKLVALFALPELLPRIQEFAQQLLNEHKEQ